MPELQSPVFRLRSGGGHCYEPIHFNLKEDESVKDKAYPMGWKIKWLASSKELLDIHFLTIFPQKQSLKEFIRKVLLKNKNQLLKLDFITPEQGENFADALRKEIETHNI